ncbi:MarR family transcriptional regulator [Halomarina pelagica]|uniref:MarR family transcriptional regulator n=1 Tax=Halomarina pelagica TaxID=2961599 RepID=UPI0020C342F1|nr:helix-turn-helix domain-containing protein [Halomarina sp. BND7]
MSTTCEPESDRGDGWESVRDLPPSAKLVAKVLEYDGPLTQREIAEATLLPTRTVRYALTRLETVDAVASRVSFTDARKRIYSLELSDNQ